MKKIILAMVAILSMATAVAQDNDKKERKAPKQPTQEEMVERMAQELNLTADQKTKVLALNKEYADVLGRPGMGRGGHRGGPRPDGQTGATEKQGDKKVEKQADKKADKKGDRKGQRPELTDEQKAQMKQQMEKRKEYDAKLKNILTDEQYQKLQKQRHHRGGHGGPRGQRGPRQEQQ